MHYFLSILVLQSSLRGRKAGCFSIIVLQMYCYIKGFFALPHSTVVGLRCVIVVLSDHTHCFFKATQPLISTYNQFCEVVDNGKKVRAVFCDISKAFDNKAFWHNDFNASFVV